MVCLLFNLVLTVRIFSGEKELSRIEIGEEGKKIVEIKHGNLFFDGYKRDSVFIKEFKRIKIFKNKRKIKDRKYRGDLVIKKRGNEIFILNVVEIEDYLKSVVGAEMGEGMLEAKKAQAVVSRTFILKNLKRHGEFDFCDLTHCQYYPGKKTEDKETIEAVEKTKGEVLVYHNNLCDVFYHSTCGGRTAYLSSIWNAEDRPYLTSVDDKFYCKKSPFYRWDFFMDKKEFEEIIGIRGILDIFLDKAKDGRVKYITIKTKEGKIKLRGWRFRMMVCEKKGWNSLKSSYFDIYKTKDGFVFKGRGLGHGVGLCQWGAKELARMGWDYKKILSYYFPKTEVKKWKY